jgi:trehalose/maltose transport system substrate-binding protein
MGNTAVVGPDGQHSRGSSKSVWPALWILLFAVVLDGWAASREPVTLTYFRLGWSQPDEVPTAEPLSRRFIRQTGIQVENLPVPETTLDRLDLSRKLLETGSRPDVLGVDMIWSGVLGGELIDLRPYLETELSMLEPQLLSSYIVDGRLVAIPYNAQIGVLEYRADLLRNYGYDHPPRTWNELEAMAARIQSGERTKGKKNFWGYVWQGAAAESLTCNALEWQVSEGGGQIIENDGTVSVNNPATIRSWERAKRWIGWISPPSILAYRQLDSSNVFDSGQAAFNHVWVGIPITPTGQLSQFYQRGWLAQGRIGYTRMPSGNAGWAATLGGSGLAVSRHSPHPQEAIQLIRFLIRAQVESSMETEKALSNRPKAYDRGSIPELAKHSDMGGVVSRPSITTGEEYEQVTRDYIEAVHAVLSGEKKAPDAVSLLERQLIRITGFSTGPPKTRR